MYRIFYITNIQTEVAKEERRKRLVVGYVQIRVRGNLAAFIVALAK